MNTDTDLCPSVSLYHCPFFLVRVAADKYKHVTNDDEEADAKEVLEDIGSFIKNEIRMSIGNVSLAHTYIGLYRIHLFSSPRRFIPKKQISNENSQYSRKFPFCLFVWGLAPY